MAGTYKNITVLTSAALIFLASISYAVAGNQGKEVTPYGDFCKRCTEYGTCDSIMSDEGANKAIIEYYNAKGLKVTIEKNRGRFIKATIINKDDDNVVDVIIFDRRTGRVRSIY